MSGKPETRFREMSGRDIEFAVSLVHSAGWASESRETFEAFLAHDPAGCLVAEIAGRPAGLCCATRYRDNGFIGELIVERNLRIFGIGRLLLDRAVDYLEAVGAKNIFLDGDLNAVPFYEYRGFRNVCRSLRFKGTIEGRRHDGVRPLRPGDLDALCALDRELFGDDRGFFLRRRAGIPGNLGFVLERNGNLDGFIMARPGDRLLAVGPWASVEGDRGALSLLEHLAAETGPVVFRLGPLESHPSAVRLLRSRPGLIETTPSRYMVKGETARLGLHPGLYAIGSAAKG